MAFHNAMSRGAWRGDYNPTQAGDGSAMSLVTGVACQENSAVTILTMMLDFNHNNGFYEKPLIAVWGGRMNDMAPLSYFSPYTLETRARWVAKPAGAGHDEVRRGRVVPRPGAHDGPGNGDAGEEFSERPGGRRVQQCGT
jgi:hypothetical protein